MRRALNNNLPPLERRRDEPDVVRKYQDQGAMVLLDLCFWAGAKDISIADYVHRQKVPFLADNYHLQLDKAGKPAGYSLWSLDKDRATIHQQSLPFGGHLSHLKELKKPLRGIEKVSLKLDGARQNAPDQILW